MLCNLGLGTYLTMEDIQVCTKTRSILQSLGPIAQKIVQLKLHHKGVTCDASVVLHMMRQCELLETAIIFLRDNLNILSKHLKDDVLAEEVEHIWHSLDFSLKGLTDATRDLHRGDTGLKNNNEVWDELLNFAEQLLGGLTKALLCWDHAHIRRVNKALDDTLSSLEAIKAVRSIEYLPASFQKFIRKVSELIAVVAERSLEIVDKWQKESLHILCLQLRSILPILTSVISGCVVHPLSKHMKGSRDLVFERIHAIISDLKINVGMGQEYYDLQEPGNFMRLMERLYEMLTIRIDAKILAQKLPLIEDIKAPLEIVLKHSISVAQCCSKHDYSTIMAACENVLQQMKVMSSLERCDYPTMADVEVTLDVLADAIGILEHKVTITLIRLIAMTFADPFAKLDAVSAEVKRISERGTSDEVNGKEDHLEHLLHEFEKETDLIFQLGGLAISCCSSPSEARKLQCILRNLDWVERNLGPSILRCSKDDHPHLRHQIYILSKMWRREINQLSDCIDPILEPSSYSFVIKKEVHQIWALMQAKLPSWDLVWIQMNIRKVSCLSNRLLERNGFDTFLLDTHEKHLQRALKEMKKYEKRIIAENDLSEHRKQGLLHRVQHVLTLLSQISSFLNDGESLEMTEEIMGYGIYQDAAKLQHKLSDSEKCVLQTSDILDIPIDVVTPCAKSLLGAGANESKLASSFSSGLNNLKKDPSGMNLPQLSIKEKSGFRLKRWNSKSTKLSEELKSSLDKGKYAQAQMNEELEVRNGETSTDIANFLLCRSTNTQSNFTRESKRNFSIWVKKINVDLEEVLPITPQGKPIVKNCDPGINSTLSDYVDEKTSEEESYYNKGRRRCSSANFTEIFEKMESFASSFAVSSLRFDFKNNENVFSKEDGVNKNLLETNKNLLETNYQENFNSIFAELSSLCDKPVLDPSESGETPTKIKLDPDNKLTWKDFTGILGNQTIDKKEPGNHSTVQTKTTSNSNHLNVQIETKSNGNQSTVQTETTSNGNQSTVQTGTTEHLNIKPKVQVDRKNSSDTESALHSVNSPLSNTSVNQNVSSPVSVKNLCPSDVTSLIAYSSPNSVCIKTPERLKDLKMVYNRLAKLKSIF